MTHLILMRTSTAVITAASFLVGCTAYTPIPVTQATTSGAVRLTIGESSYNHSFGVLGSQVSAVEGEVQSVNDSSVTIAARDVVRLTGDEEQFHGESVTIPRQDISGFDRRHLDGVRSLLLTGAITGVAIWIASQGHGAIGFGKTAAPGGQQ
jgi:hypothetical protein